MVSIPPIASGIDLQEAGRWTKKGSRKIGGKSSLRRQTSSLAG